MQIWKAIEWYAKGSSSIYNCGETYNSLQWHEGNKLRKPTLQQLEQAWEKYLENENRFEYKKKRLEAFMPWPDQLEVIYNFGIDEWIKYITSVCEKYPSPDQTAKPKIVSPMDTINKEITDLKTEVNTKFNSYDKDIASLITASSNTHAAILAIKGFMMEIPNIQKSLLELKDMVQPK